MKKSILVLGFTLGAFACQAQEPASARELVSKMYSTYTDTWYHAVTFSQQTEFFKNGAKQREEKWYEAMDMKSGSLVIKFNSMTSGSGMIFRNDSLLTFTHDTVKTKISKIHELIVLGFSVYTSDPESTLTKIKASGFDTERFTTEMYNSRKHYVVGDPEKAQFWIDAKTLLFTKLKKILPNGRVSEIEFKGYQKLGRGLDRNRSYLFAQWTNDYARSLREYPGAKITPGYIL